jgi:hypothetical protein
MTSKLFKERQALALDSLQEFKQAFAEFSKVCSPDEWRTIGNHVTEIRNMEQSIHSANEITEAEKKISWVQDEIRKDIEW